MHSGFMALEQLCPLHSSQTGERLSPCHLQVHLEVWQLVKFLQSHLKTWMSFFAAGNRSLCKLQLCGNQESSSPI